MPELTANIKVGLGIIAATAALVTGLLGNVLAANISAFFSGTQPKAGKRPAILWLAFFVSATLSVVAGSLATFAPAASAARAGQPKIVLTNTRTDVLHLEPKGLFLICRDTVQIANTSDVATSVVAVGTQINIDGTLIKIDPTDAQSVQANDTMRLAVSLWQVAPLTKRYANVRSVDDFIPIKGTALPAKVDARSTAAVTIDYAIRFLTAMPQSVTAMHTLRFPDVQDLQTPWMQCK